MTEMKSPNAHARENRNDTPRKRKTHIIKVRVTAEEKLRIAYACKELHLNQLARHFNSGGKDTEQLRAQILEELSALTNFRLKAEETVGELYGNHQAFDLEKL